MQGISQWAFSICTAMAACGIAQLLLPKSGLEKMLKVTISVFFLCCILSPVFLQRPELRIQAQDYSMEEINRRAQQLTGVVDRQTQNLAGADLEKIIADKLLEKGINHVDITINITTDGQSGEPVPQAEITLDREYEAGHDQIRAMLTRELGIEVRLGYV